MNFGLGSVFIASLLTATAQIFYKLAVSNQTEFNLIVLVSTGFILYGISSILILLSLRALSVSIVFPILASTFVWVSILATLFLGETLTLLQWCGVSLIVIGVTVVGVNSD